MLEATLEGVLCSAVAQDSGSWGWRSERPCWPCSQSPEVGMEKEDVLGQVIF